MGSRHTRGVWGTTTTVAGTVSGPGRDSNCSQTPWPAGPQGLLVSQPAFRGTKSRRAEGRRQMAGGHPRHPEGGPCLGTDGPQKPLERHIHPITSAETRHAFCT